MTKLVCMSFFEPCIEHRNKCSDAELMLTQHRAVGDMLTQHRAVGDMLIQHRAVGDMLIQHRAVGDMLIQHKWVTYNCLTGYGE